MASTQKLHDYLKVSDKTFNEISKPVYFGTLFLIHLSYFLVFFGIFSINTYYLNYLNIFIQGFIAVFLMYRFFPFRTHYLRDFDPQIIFACGMFLFINTFSIEVARAYDLIGKNLNGVKDSVIHLVKNT